MQHISRLKTDTQQIFYIDGTNLNPSVLEFIIQRNLKIDLSQKTWQHVSKSRQIITDMMKDPNRIVYGINTGFGNFADKIITHQQRSQLQINLIRSHSVCVGQPVPFRTVKRMTILRINTLAKGRSGIHPKNLQRIIKAYNSNYIPMIPQKGTVGASGDLAPLSHLALGMMGEGLAWNQKQQKYTSALQIMKNKNIQPIQLKQKQGLALINGTQFMSSIISEVAELSQRMFQSAIVVYAFAVQIFGLEKELFSQKIITIYQKKNKKFASILRKIGEYFDQKPSQLHEDRMRKQNQKPQNKRAHSIIHQTQSFSGFIQSLQFATKLITQQMNSATDNPLVYSKQDGFEQDMLISAGNFHGQYVAKAADFISIALFNIGRFSQSRIQRYVNGRTSKLPDFLVKFGGLNSGLMIAQYTSAALLSESKVLVKPASVDSISTSASQQDHVSMGGYAVRKAKTLYQNISHILGIQLMCCLQAIDLLNLTPSNRLQEIKQKVRQSVNFMQVDKFYGPQITIAKNLIQKI